MATLAQGITASAAPIVVAVDLSSLSERVLKAARERALAAPAAEIHLLHVLTPAVLPGDALGVAPDVSPPVAALVTDARRKLEELCEQTMGVDAKRTMLHVRLGDPAAEITRLAEELGAEMIVVGTEGRTRLSLLVRGSTAARVMRAARCSVLTVHAGDPELEPPCHDCVEARFASQGKEQWCARHTAHHVRPHTYHAGGGENDFAGRSFRF